MIACGIITAGEFKRVSVLTEFYVTCKEGRLTRNMPPPTNPGVSLMSRPRVRPSRDAARDRSESRLDTSLQRVKLQPLILGNHPMTALPIMKR